MVGAGRNEAADTSNGAELYVVIGQAPRHLDRNMTMVGRVVSGIELLSTLPRGTGPLGFYARPEERTPLTRVRIASDYPADTRPRLERLRTDTATFRAYLDARRSRREPFFVEPLGRLDVCNVQVPVRAPVP
jgi:peptidylprolyl isomerase